MCFIVSYRKNHHCASTTPERPQYSQYVEPNLYRPQAPAGTYRPLDYDAVAQCIPCPPGRFREATKGKSLDSCSKCPSSTYNEKFGATSILDCVRCPAGTFMEEEGASKCLCITPASCKNEYDSPADAEKRDTVPYIGRW